MILNFKVQNFSAPFFYVKFVENAQGLEYNRFA